MFDGLPCYSSLLALSEGSGIVEILVLGVFISKELSASVSSSLLMLAEVRVTRLEEKMNCKNESKFFHDFIPTVIA